MVDMEAGLEHLSRGTGRHMDRILAVLEPYYRSMETASRVADLAKELGIPEVLAVSNKVRDEADRKAIAEFCAKRGLKLVAEIPHDPAWAEAERSGASPIDHASSSPAIRAIRELATHLIVAVLCMASFVSHGASPRRVVDRTAVGFNGAAVAAGVPAAASSSYRREVPGTL